MAKNGKHTFFINFRLLLIVAIFIYGCASMKSPEGGPRDTTPPKVLKMTPENLSTNFKAKKITIEFDEYIKLNNEFKEFSISPELEKAPELKAKLKRLEINLPDSLEQNTTYTLNFGKSIVDINEGNQLKNFTYVFATGPTLDSLTITGHVTNALSGEPEIEATVFIFPLSRDSLFGKKKPSIFTLTDSSGNFKLNNIKKDTYKIYALKEKNGDRIYQQASDEIGFIKDPIVLNKNVDSIDLKIFKEIADNFRVVDKKLNNDGSIFISFNQKLNQPEISIIEPANIDKGKLFKFSKNGDSLSLWLDNFSFDSVKIALKNQGKTLDTIKFNRGKKDTYNRVIAISDNLENGVLNPNRDLIVHFNLPIKSIDESKIMLLEDSIPRKGFTLTKDSLDFLKYHLKYKWKPKEDYILTFKENAVTAIFDAKNKEIKKTFTLGQPLDYGTLTLSVETPDTSKNYILQIVNKEKEVISSYPILRNTKITLANYKAGIYFARIVYDENKNGIWDTGNVKQGIQPEPIWYEPKEQSIRANWAREEIIKIPLKPLPVVQKPKPVPENKPKIQPR